MKAKAPGKLVLSGAYSVLRGEPALVSAVDRYVIADTERPASFAAPEVVAAFELLYPGASPRPSLPAFDASALRESGRKLGLGSSAAIVVASLRAIAPDLADDELLRLARRAHRIAQGGGSGIDVAAAVYGGHQLLTIVGDELVRATIQLPKAIVLECWAMPEAASTADFVRRVFALESGAPTAFRQAFAAQCQGARAAAQAVLTGDADAFIAALSTQRAALNELGELASLPIVTESVRALGGELEDACFLPAGAGGGDVTLYVGKTPSSLAFRKQAGALGLELLGLSFGASGANLVLP